LMRPSSMSLGEPSPLNFLWGGQDNVFAGAGNSPMRPMAKSGPLASVQTACLSVRFLVDLPKCWCCDSSLALSEPPRPECIRKGKKRLRSGFRVGRQAHIMPMFHSTAVQSAMGTLSHETSWETDMSDKLLKRTMLITQTLAFR
jgi:hypothetical protein